MGWLIAAAVAVTVFVLWLKAKWYAAILMWPVWLWAFWLAFLPPEPSRFQWFLGAAVSFIVTSLPVWIAENRGPQYTIYPPRRF